MTNSYSDYYKNHYKASFSEADIKIWCRWFDVQWRFIKRHIKLKKNMRILEIGPGYGGVYYLLKDMGITDYVGLDLDPDIVRFTNKFFKTKVFRYQSIEEIKDTKGFDVIFAFEVLEHIQDPTLVTKKIHSLLKSDGIFCGSTPYPYTRNIWSDETHISVLHPGNWIRLFRNAGFKYVAVYPMSFAPFLWRIHRKLNFRIPAFLPIKSFVSTSLIIAKKSK